MATRRELAAAEDAAWAEVWSLVGSLSDEQLELPGYSPEWSVKDLLGHLGGWQAEAVQVLEQLRYGTYRPLQADVDELNARFYEANRDQPPSVVRAEVSAARTRLLREWHDLPEVSAVAEHWFRESGPLHYLEHLDGLRRWVAEMARR